MKNAFIVIGALLLFALLIYSVSFATVKEPSKFEVVDTYKSCDVVRYLSSAVSTYKYFLDCSNK